jgi:hypothetical protein
MSSLKKLAMAKKLNLDLNFKFDVMKIFQAVCFHQVKEWLFLKEFLSV